MLFSIPEPGWYAIAAAATVFFMIGMRAISVGVKLPDELRSALGEHNRRANRVFYFVAPVFAVALLAVKLQRPEPASLILFLYSVAFVAIPIAILPVRARILKATLAQQQNTITKSNPDHLVTAWIVGFLCTVMLVAVFALMTTRYDMHI